MPQERPNPSADATNPSESTPNQPKRLGRRTILRIGAGILGGAVVDSLVGGFVARRALDGVGELLHLLDRGGKLESAYQDFLKLIHSQPSEKQLLQGVFGNGKKISTKEVASPTKEKPQPVDIDVITLGDSDVYTDGFKNDHAKKGESDSPLNVARNQPNTFVELARLQLKSSFKKLGIGSWRNFVFAVPGAPSGPGFLEESRQYGLLSGEQLRNPAVKTLLREGNQMKVVVMSLSGDDWRNLIKNAAQLSQLLSRIMVTKNIDNITPREVEEFRKLKAQSDVIAQQFGTNIKTALTEIAQISKERTNNNLPGIKVVLTHAVSGHDITRLPVRSIKGNETFSKDSPIQPVPGHPDRGYIDLKKIPYGQDIAYIITASMYKQFNAILPEMQQKHPELDLYTNPWMKIAKYTNGIFSIDGHFNKKGQQLLAGQLAALFQ